MRTIESYLPIFTGFYGSYFDSDIAEENTIYNLVECEGLDITCDDVDFDYQDYQNRVAMACVDSIENYLKHDGFSIAIEFEKVYSPREYNFSNDVIYCTYKVSDEDFMRLLNYTKANLSEFKGFLIEKYSSSPGFISFFSTESKIWLNEYLNEDSDKFTRAFAGLLEFYLANEGYSADDMLDDCTEETSYIDHEILTTS